MAALSIAAYAGYLVYHRYASRTLQVCVVSDFSIREQKPRWDSLMNAWFAEVNRVFEPAKLKWNFVYGGEAYPAGARGSLAERRNRIEDTTKCNADVVLGLTGRPDEADNTSVSPFGHVALVAITAKDSDAMAAASLARSLGVLFGAAYGINGAKDTSGGDVFDTATLKAIRDLRWYDFAQGISALSGSWESRAAGVLAEAAAGKVSNPEANSHRVLARAFAEGRKHSYAVAQMRQAVEAAPQDAALHLELALEMQANAEPAEAVKQLRESARLDPKDARPHAVLGAYFLNTRRVEEAVEELRIATRLDPRNAGYLAVLGKALSSQAGQLDAAAAAFDAAVRLKPDENGAQQGLEMMVSMKDAAQNDIKELQATARQNPASVDAHLRLGVAEAGIGNLDGAEKAFQRSIELDPRNGLAHLAMARLRYLQGQYPAAAKEIESAKAAGMEPALSLVKAVNRKLGVEPPSDPPSK